MSLARDLLTILSSYRGGYRLMQARMRGYTGPARQGRHILSFSGASDNTLRVTFSRLKKRGLVEGKFGEWKITSEGKRYLNVIRRRFNWPAHSSKQSLRKSKNMIVVFDIPEIHKLKREWLRAELVNLGFVMLQKSVWFGPAPLPKKFLEAINQLRLISCLKFFKAEEVDIV